MLCLQFSDRPWKADGHLSGLGLFWASQIVGCEFNIHNAEKNNHACTLHGVHGLPSHSHFDQASVLRLSVGLLGWRVW
jgi:hypothetical protein